MPAIEIGDRLWDRVTTLAREKRKSPSDLARRALSEFLEREEDEHLLKRSNSAARRAPFRMEETESEIRRRRRSRHAK